MSKSRPHPPIDYLRAFGQTIDSSIFWLQNANKWTISQSPLFTCRQLLPSTSDSSNRLPNALNGHQNGPSIIRPAVKPIVSLVMASASQQLLEGTDLFFECNVQVSKLQFLPYYSTFLVSILDRLRQTVRRFLMSLAWQIGC